ncbi:MAG: autotransporter assembly complex protein TamA [Rhodobacteraceae bacterium]|nr:autotransporter assembly complex protein TamA [Paracoccaceae bacterium]
MVSVKKALPVVFFAAMISGTAPAYGFEIFGIHLFGRAANTSAPGGVSYTFEFSAGEASRELSRTLRAASTLIQDRNIAQDEFFELLARAKSDYRTLLATLYSEGYYGGDISILVDGREAADIPFTANMPANVSIQITVNPGPLFKFGAVGISPMPAPAGRDDVLTDGGLVRGNDARATVVLETVELALTAWRQQGYALAEVVEKSVTAEHNTGELSVDVEINPGRLAHYGNLEISGAESLDPEFLRYMANLPAGGVYDPRQVARARERLMRTGALQSTNFKLGEEIDANGILPFVLEANEMALRNIGFGAEYSTIDGFGVRGTWRHRNLFGKAEQLRFDVSAGRIDFATNWREWDYNLRAAFAKPGFLFPDMDLLLSVEGDHTLIDHIEQRHFELLLGGKYYTRMMEFGAYAFASYSETRDINGFQDFKLVGLRGEVSLDRRDDPLNPTSGFYLATDIRGMQELVFDNTIGRATLEARYYRAFGEDDRVVLAGRGYVGTMFGAPISQSPDSLLFYTGGDGSVRGFDFRSIGTTDAGVFSGGLSVIELSAEVRVQVTDSIGVVVFADAGEVGDTRMPGSGGDWRFGAGVGVRYFTSLGPLRFDIARGINRGPNDPKIGLYLGLGHSF